MAVILPIVFALLSILNLVLFVMVLIKLFKNEGVLKGILGLICGIYTFIWGWIKHRQLQITKLMIIWTASSLIPFVIQIVMVAAGIGTLTDDFQKMMVPPSPTPPPGVVQRRVQKPPPKPPGAQVAQEAQKPGTKPAPPPAKPSASEAGVDYAFEMKRVDKLLTLNDKNPDALYNRGWLYHYKGELETAEKDYSRAIELNRKDGDAFFNRGLLYVRMKKFQQALDDFSSVLGLQPHAAPAFCNRGNVHFQMGNTDLALKDYEEGLKIDSKDPDLYYNRGILYQAKNDEAKAMEDFRRAAELGHDRARAYLKLPPAKAGDAQTPDGQAPGVSDIDPGSVNIPETPASGKIHGTDFSVEAAKLENGILTLRQGKDFFPDRALLIFLFLKKGENPAGRTYEIGTEQKPGAPHIHMKYRLAGKDVPETEMFIKGYVMRLVFGKMDQGGLEGKIFLTLPDQFRSSVAGTFQAKVE